MAENSSISWCDHTFNPWVGCTKVSPACDGCYAEHLMARRMGRVIWGAPGMGEGTRDRTSEANWKKPLTWNRKAAAKVEAWRTNPFALAETPKPSTFVFCASLADVFDNAVPAEWRRDLFDLIRATPNLTWLLLTKRPGNIVKLFRDTYASGRLEVLADRWPRNAAIGCTVVTQEEADRDVPKLLAAKAALNPAFAFLSMEPLLGPVDLTAVSFFHGAAPQNALFPGGVDWIIAGGETDQGEHKARPADPAWFRSLRDQCAAAGVSFHFKQWGEWQPYVEQVDGRNNRYLQANFGANQTYLIGKAHDPCTLDGVLHDARPNMHTTGEQLL